MDMSQLNNTVTTVLNDIRTRGDAAVKEYEQRFDHVSLDSLAVSDKEIESARSRDSMALLWRHAPVWNAGRRAWP